MAMNLRINSEDVHIPETITTVTMLVEHFKLKSPFVIVEHNHEIIERDLHAATRIADGDVIELVQFVGGG